LLALVVLAQNPKGGGLASGFTGASQIGGVQRTADFLEKSTWTLASSLMVLCLVSTSLQTTGSAQMDELDAPSEQVTSGDVAPESVQPPAEEAPTSAAPAGQEAPQGVPAQQVPAQTPTPVTPE